MVYYPVLHKYLGDDYRLPSNNMGIDCCISLWSLFWLSGWFTVENTVLTKLLVILGTGTTLKKLKEGDQNWFLYPLDSLVEVGEEEWTTKTATALVSQLAMYDPDSTEKAFNLRAIGQATRLATSDQLILDNLSAIYLAAVTDTATVEGAAAVAYGPVAARHLGSVVDPNTLMIRFLAQFWSGSRVMLSILRKKI